MIDKLLFNSKHWLLFFAFSIWVIVIESVIVTSSLCPFPIILVWIPLLGIRVNKFLPKYYRTHYTLFIVSWIFLVGFAIYTFGIWDRTEAGWLLTTLAFIAVAAYFAMFGFVARAIKSLQTQDRATVSDYFVDVFLVLAFFPIGLWFLQPRLNLLYKQFFRD